MRIRRCTILMIEPREYLAFDLASLCSGGDGLVARIELLALAPHLNDPVPVETEEVGILNTLLATRWVDFDVFSERYGALVLHRLLDKGLVIGDDDAHMLIRERDDALRATNWQAHSAVLHYFGRWQGITSGARDGEKGPQTMNEMFERLGAPPPHVRERVPAQARAALPSPRHTALDELLMRRATCRNFDSQKFVDKSTFSDILHRVFGAQAVYEIHADNIVLKRNAPSGGGLHPLEAYLVVQRVEGVAPGLYHYHPIDNALEPLPPLDGDPTAFVRMMVAAQEYFVDAAMFIVIAARFGRSYWKYRNHSKIYRAVMLEAGHFSQNLYLSATEFGLGAFITAAINEVEIEQAFGLDPLVESPIAVLGLGHRAAACETFEFDPNRKVWPQGVAQPQ